MISFNIGYDTLEVGEIIYKEDVNVDKILKREVKIIYNI